MVVVVTGFNQHESKVNGTLFLLRIDRLQFCLNSVYLTYCRSLPGAFLSCFGKKGSKEADSGEALSVKSIALRSVSQ